MYAVASVCLLLLTNPFIDFVFGQEYVLQNSSIFIIVANFWVIGQTRTANCFRNAAGLYWQGKFRPLVNVIINLTAALLLAKPLGLNGILLGILIGNATTLLWFEPWLVYTKAFMMRSFPCFVQMLKYNIELILACVLCYNIDSLLPFDGFIGMCIRAILYASLTSVIYIASSFHTKEFLFVKDKVIKLVLRSRRK